MKRKLCLILSVILILCSMPFSTFGQVNTTSQELDYETVSLYVEYTTNIINFVLEDYLYEVTDDAIIQGIYEGLFSLVADYYTKEECKMIISDISKNLTSIDKINDELPKIILYLLEKYPNDVSDEDLLYSINKGFFIALDEYSVYYTPDQYEALVNDTAGQFVGIGVQIMEENGEIVVLSPLPESPAIKAGILPKDIIKYVDSVDISNFTTGEASSLIKGEPGTIVKIGIIRDGSLLTFEIERNTIVTSTVKGEILDNNIGYLKVSEFADNTVNKVKEQLEIFDNNNIKKIILDLRSNGGGTLKSAIDMLNLFVTKGPILYVDYKSEGEQIYYSELEEKKYDLAVLINDGSASATEVFTGAVKYKNEGIIIGTNSFGKGIVQTLYELVDNSAVKFTTAEYFSIDRTPVHKVGISPDILIENPKADLSDYPEFSKEIKPNLGDVSQDVLTAKIMLNDLGYNIDNINSAYDEQSFEQVMKFQSDNNLYPYGVIDISTQNAIYSSLVLSLEEKLEDAQLNKAIEYLLEN